MKLKIGIVTIILSTVALVSIMDLTIEHIAKPKSQVLIQSQEDLSVRPRDDLGV